jgi:CubicO group peptidase (beta-lactamase class C family)
MKWIKRIILSLLAVIILAAVGLYATGNQHIIYGLGPTYFSGKSKPDIDDMRHFHVSTIPADQPQPWPVHSRFGQPTLDAGFLSSMDSLATCALVVIHNDSLLFEQYWNGYSDTTLSNSFSMAKSFTAMLIGKALEEGYIRSLDQKASDFIPSLSGGKSADITIRHLLQMSSGIPFGESYSSPFGYMAHAYYGRDLIAETLPFQATTEPGTLWTYEGGNTVLLGLIIRAATGRTPSKYFFEKFWSCLGAEKTAHWNLDHEGGMEKTFSGFYATARDFARIGKLFMHKGVWGKDTLLQPTFVDEAIRPCRIPDVSGEECTWYGYQWWLGHYKGFDFFSCRGMRGQYIIGIPELNLVVVRLGHQQRADRRDHMPPDIYLYMDAAAALLPKDV